ncbi:hypothetical protein ACFXJ8_26435 [Nonomuraea sp. NPDC059194]|uniref:hypothetical protein n=1 Tax=Nonomuraea sp. NPDC059194 TaxID=3346764 RepID=UPI0036847EC6
MKSHLHETPLANNSPLDAAEHVFQLVSCDPAGLTVDGRTLGGELPRRPILLTELRDLLTSRTVTNATRDSVWREMVARARRDGPQWFVGAVGVAVPALRGIAGRICRGYVAGDPIDIDTEVLTAFIEALRTTDIDRPNVLPRMCDAAHRAGERARQNAEADVARRVSNHASKAPAAPWGHPDLVLADAVAKGVVSELDAELIGRTRLEKRTLAEAAAELGLTEEAAKKRRQRCEPILVDAVLAGEVEAALSLTITSAAPRRVEETSARSRITSDPRPITTESKGGWGNPTGSARTAPSTPRTRWRHLAKVALIAAVVAVVLAGTASAVLAETQPGVARVPSDLNKVFDNLRNWLIGLLAALATLMLTVGGLRYLVAGGDPGEVQKAKAALKAAAFGYGLAILAPLFVNVLKRVVGG